MDSVQLEKENDHSSQFESSDNFETNRTASSVEDSDESPKIERKLTSWESFTAILRGLVEELVKLGAQPKLRKVSFQLWASYLKHEQIAFISKTEPKLPTLPVRFKNSDAQALYKVKNLKEIIKNDSKNEHLSRTLKKKASISKNLRVKIPSPPRKSQQETKKSYVVGQYLADSESKRNVKIQMKESAFTKIAEPPKEFMRQVEKHGENIPSNLTAYVNRHRARNIKSNAAVTVNTLLAILKLALYLIEDEIQLTDLLRWACEGRLSLYRVRKFLPKHAPIRETDVIPSVRKNFFQFELLRICKMLNLNNVPSPDFFKLVERYCYELSLPREFTKFTQRLMYMFTPYMDFAAYDYRLFPDYECRAMGFIVFALKLLFSLDDSTELKQSHVADTINKCHKCPTEDNPSLFSWSSWVKFIECRKSVLCHYDVTMSQLYDYDDAKTDINVFLNYWRKNEPDTSESTSRKELLKQGTLDKLRVEALNHCASVEKSRTISLQFPSSLTPLKTYTQHLLTHHTTLLSDRCREILSNDFSSCTIRYLIDHEWAIEIGKNVEIEVKSVLDSAISERTKFEETEPNVVTISSTVPAHILTSVHIKEESDNLVDEPARILTPVQIKEESDDLDDNPAHIPTSVWIEEESGFIDSQDTFVRQKKFKSKFEPVVSDDDSLFKLYYPSTNYWVFHHVDRNTKQENFNKIALENFSNSFLWLLKECSRIVRCSSYELIMELIIIERVYANLFADGDIKSVDKLQFNSNEW